MKATVSAVIQVGATAAELSHCLADYRCVSRYIEGLEQLVPADSQVVGVGASFDATMQVGPRSVHTTIELVDVKPGQLVRWRSDDGGGRDLTFTLEPGDAPGSSVPTMVSLAISYERPGGWKGALLSVTLDATIRSRAQRSLERLAAHYHPDV